MKWERTLVVCEKVNCYLVQYYIKLIKRNILNGTDAPTILITQKKDEKNSLRISQYSFWCRQSALDAWQCEVCESLKRNWKADKKQKTYKISKSLLNHRLEFIRTIDKDLIIDSKTDVGSSFFLLCTLSVFFPDIHPRLPPLPDFIRKGLDEFSIFYIKNGNSKSHSLLSSRGVFDRSQSRLLSITFS